MNNGYNGISVVIVCVAGGTTTVNCLGTYSTAHNWIEKKVAANYCCNFLYII